MSSAGIAVATIREDPAALSIDAIGSTARHYLQLPDDSIMIYLSVSGSSVVPFRVLDSDSIASVKLRIQTCKGFVVKNQRLVFDGRELARDDGLVRDYGIGDGNVLHLVLRFSDLRAITVKTTCGRTFQFHVDATQNVRYVKRQIAKKGKGFANLNDQKLICDGEELEDQRPIHDISRNSEYAVIHLVVNKSAKVRTKPVQNDFELSIHAPAADDALVTNENVPTTHGDDVVVGLLDGQRLQLTQTADATAAAKAEGPLLPPERGFCLEPVFGNPGITVSPVIKDLLQAAFSGLENGRTPVRSPDGSGGAYFMQDAAGHNYVAVFKPIDEEPLAINNPQGLPMSPDGEGLKRGTRVGEGAFREVAAYILDHPLSGPRPLSSYDSMGFAGVPPTVMIRCLHQGFNHPQGYHCSHKDIKLGSLQMFMKNNGTCEDMGPGAFPVQEVHKISVLDIRLANTDRHAGNILLACNKQHAQGPNVLVPIDHGYCLPENFEDCTFEWLYWPQARVPYNSEAEQYVKSLNAEKDIALLKFHGWDLSIECARTLHISTMLLKKGVERKLTPFAIGSILCRETIKKKSVIEEIVHEAKEAVLPGSSEVVFLETISEIMDRRLDELTA